MRIAETADQFSRLVAKRIMDRRLALGMSKLAVSRVAGLDQRAITFVENHVRVPSISTLYRIAFALGVTVEELAKSPDDLS
jgi:transcriptional regulator with XRE-family HTH domain